MLARGVPLGNSLSVPFSLKPDGDRTIGEFARAATDLRRRDGGVGQRVVDDSFTMTRRIFFPSSRDKMPLLLIPNIITSISFKNVQRD
jgi:hypothetical protein